MADYPYFPLFVDLSRKNILVVGGGNIAKRRIETLAQFTERLTVVSPEMHPALAALEDSGKLNVLRRRFQPEDVEGMELVCAATNDPAANEAVRRACAARGIPVNVSSDKSASDFYFPGIARRENVVIGVTASGKDHAEAKRVTERARALLKINSFPCPGG